jgi:hypothetical protein
MRLWLLSGACAVMLGASPFAQAAAGVWRCTVEGQVVYRDAPCAEGRELEPLAPRPTADVMAAQRLAAEERQRADRLVQERLRRETAAAARPNLQPINLSAKKPAPTAATPKATKKRQKASAADRDAAARIWRATAPASPRTAD